MQVMTNTHGDASKPRESEVGTPEGLLYELTAGELCLDFANTVDARPTEARRELLAEYDDLIRWSVQAGIITAQTAKRLRKKAPQHRRQASTALRRARLLREAIFEVFNASAQGVSPAISALDTLNEHVAAAFSRLRIGRSEGSFQWEWEWEEEDALDRMLWPVARSAAELLTSDRLKRVRVCSAAECDWLFLDQSKNSSRRWCDMTVCGNRAKARRFRQTQLDR